MEKIKVLLVDDHDIVRRGLKMLLEEERHIEIIAEASDGQEALTKIKDNLPDVVILDLTMPKISGLEVTKAITEQFPMVKTLIFFDA